MIPPDLKELERALGHRFKRRELLEQAVSHSSYAREVQAESHAQDAEGDSPRAADYEQMEFLGDAVLGLVTSQTLFERFPEFREGRLSKVRAYLVSEKHLIRPATKLRIGRYLRLGRGEDKSGGRKKTTLQVDALEAVLAALYIDAGLEKVREVILGKIIDPELKRLKKQVVQGLPITDYKSALQEALHSVGAAPPVYVLVREEGPQHSKTFTIEVRICVPTSLEAPAPAAEGKSPGSIEPKDAAPMEFVGRGDGGTKKKAEQAAAQQALEYLWSIQSPKGVETRRSRTVRPKSSEQETNSAEHSPGEPTSPPVRTKRSRAKKP
ncbi:MAG: ribonuclease III [Terriglobales bacterium]|jgi:ribonuclease-3